LNIFSFASLEEAIDYFEQAIELDAAFLPAQAGLARAILSQGRTGAANPDLAANQAEEIAQEMLGIDPDFAAGHVILGLVARERNNFSLAIEHYERALALGDSDPETMAELVRMLLYTGGDPIRMRALLDRAMQSDPLNVELHLVVWETKLIQGTSDGALEILLRAAELAPDALAPALLAGLYSGQVLGNVADAIRYLEVTERMDPADPDAGIYLSRAYSAVDDGEKTQYWSSRAVDLSPKYGRAILSKVEQLRLAGRSDEAFALAQETLAATDIGYRGLKMGRVAMENGMVRSFFEREDFAGAEEFLLSRYPELPQLLDGAPAQDLDDLAPVGHNFLAVLELAYIYRQTGRGDDADRLMKNLDFITADNINFVYEDEATPFEGPRLQLRGDDHWGLAVVAVGREQTDAALTHLETAAEFGYLMNWRFRFLDHPALWSLRDHPRYKALIASIEANMAEQRQALIAGTPDHQPIN
jgi:tetratricopeptide (TPR) repeat protein